MPEIAEVRLNLDLLNKHLLHQELVGIEILSGRFKKKKPERFQKFQQSLPAKVILITPRGKHLIVRLDNGWTVWIGFGMSGKLTLDETYPYLRIKLLVDPGKAGGPLENIYFSDMRNFANWYFFDQESDLEKQLANFGPDLLLSKDWPKKDVVARFRMFDKQKIGDIWVAHQKLFAGVGNYLRAEALYRAKIYPMAQIKDLSDDQLYKLFHELVTVAEEAYRVQKSWKDPNRPYEEYQDLMQVYQHKTDPLGHPVKQERIKGRTLHWVPAVQVIGKKP